MGDAEDAGDDGVGLADGELLGDDVLGDAIEEDDEGGDGEDEDALVAGLVDSVSGCSYWGVGSIGATSGLRLRWLLRCRVGS